MLNGEQMNHNEVNVAARHCVSLRMTGLKTSERTHAGYRDACMQFALKRLSTHTHFR